MQAISRCTPEYRETNREATVWEDQPVIDALTAALGAKDIYTRGHSMSVARYAAELARYIGWTEAEVELVHMTGLLHDIGKIGVADAILNKQERLTADEQSIMASHPVVGEAIVAGVPELAATLPGIRHHHERWDGRGYPDNLAGTDIPTMARLLAVADTYDAMTTDRPYRKGLSVDVALAEIEKGAGAQFDPMFALAFVHMMRARIATPVMTLISEPTATTEPAAAETVVTSSTGTVATTVYGSIRATVSTGRFAESIAMTIGAPTRVLSGITPSQNGRARMQQLGIAQTTVAHLRSSDPSHGQGCSRIFWDVTAINPEDSMPLSPATEVTALSKKSAFADSCQLAFLKERVGLTSPEPSSFEGVAAGGDLFPWPFMPDNAPLAGGRPWIPLGTRCKQITARCHAHVGIG